MARILRQARVETTAGETFIITRYENGRLEYERTHSRPGGAQLPDDEGELTSIPGVGFEGRAANLGDSCERPVIAYLHRLDAVGLHLMCGIGGKRVDLGISKTITMLVGKPVEHGGGFF